MNEPELLTKDEYASFKYRNEWLRIVPEFNRCSGCLFQPLKRNGVCSGSVKMEIPRGISCQHHVDDDTNIDELPLSTIYIDASDKGWERYLAARVAQRIEGKKDGEDYTL